jgi:hypothetical protein
MNDIKEYSADTDIPSTIIVVSGLPRSGTSMAMKMLEAGGMPILTDRIRQADDDNPRGYYEFERVKRVKEDRDWLPEAVGKAVKIISFLLLDVPPGYRYKVIFVRRAMAEVLASQRQMLVRRGEAENAGSDDRMALLYKKHLRKVAAWLEAQPYIDTLYLDHREMIHAPRAAAEAIDAFLGGGLDVSAMAAAVDPDLYRQRA